MAEPKKDLAPLAPLVSAALQGILSNPELCHGDELQFDEIAKDAVTAALIAQELIAAHEEAA